MSSKNVNYGKHIEARIRPIPLKERIASCGEDIHTIDESVNGHPGPVLGCEIDREAPLGPLESIPSPTEPSDRRKYHGVIGTCLITKQGLSHPIQDGKRVWRRFEGCFVAYRPFLHTTLTPRSRMKHSYFDSKLQMTFGSVHWPIELLQILCCFEFTFTTWIIIATLGKP